MSSERTKEAVLRSYARKPGQTFEQAAADVGKVKSTIHAAVNELREEERIDRAYCEACGGPVWNPRT